MHVARDYTDGQALCLRAPLRQTAQLHHTLDQPPTRTPATHPPPAQYGEDGEEMKEDEGGEGEGINCDACGADCFAESYLCGEEDICPACYRKPEGAYPADAEHQRQGVAVPAQKVKAKAGGGGKKAKK